jgi:hypothetical protein
MEKFSRLAGYATLAYLPCHHAPTQENAFAAAILKVYACDLLPCLAEYQID